MTVWRESGLIGQDEHHKIKDIYIMVENCSRNRRLKQKEHSPYHLVPRTKECKKLSTLPFFFFFNERKAMAPHSSTLAWKIPWTEEPGRLQSMGLLRVGHN